MSGGDFVLHSDYISCQDLKMVAVPCSQVDLSPLNKANPYMHHNFHALCDYFIILGWIIFSFGKAKKTSA